MASGYIITKIGGQVSAGLYNEVIAQTRADIVTLPTDPEKISFGSQCLCLEDASVWILGNDEVWVEL